MNLFSFFKKLQDNNYLSSTVILCMDMVVSVGSTLISLFLAGLLFPPRIAGGSILTLWLLGSSFFSIIIFLSLKTHKSIIRHSTLREQVRLSTSSFLKGVALLLLLWSIPSVALTAPILGTIFFDVLLNVTGLIVMRIAMTVVYDMLQRNRHQNDKVQRVLIYGMGSKEVSLVTQLQNSKNQKVIGFIKYGHEMKDQKLKDMPICHFENKDSLDSLKSQLRLDAILFAHVRDARSENARLIKYCIESGVKILVAPSISEAVDGQLDMKAIREVKIEDLLGRDV